MYRNIIVVTFITGKVMKVKVETGTAAENLTKTATH